MNFLLLYLKYYKIKMCLTYVMCFKLLTDTYRQIKLPMQNNTEILNQL